MKHLTKQSNWKNERQKVYQNARLREGDKVVVLAGSEKGRTGTILRRTRDKFVIQGLNVKQKASKASEANPQGGFVSLEAPMHASNVTLAGKDDKPVKLRQRLNAEGRKELFYEEDGKEVIHRVL